MWGLLAFYPGTWTVDSLWYETPYQLAIYFYNRIPDKLYRESAHTAMVTQRIDVFMRSLAGSKSELPELVDYLLPFARPASMADQVYSEEVMRAVRLAFALGVMSTSHAEEMGWQKLRRSGLHRDAD
jgi:hypothetical protein